MRFVAYTGKAGQMHNQGAIVAPNVDLALAILLGRRRNEGVVPDRIRIRGKKRIAFKVGVDYFYMVEPEWTPA